MLTVISSIVIILLVVYIQSQVFGNIDRPLTAFVWPICFMLLYAVIPACRQSSSFGRVIIYLSSISYELYICQSIAFILLGEKGLYHPVVYIILLFMLCTIVASVCKSLTNRIIMLSSR
jgi:peptidoglycan/LPS O-acetylase OafA/YrhL